MLRRLLLHTSNYSLSSILVTLAGLISFPIFTRIFGVSGYGTLNLVSSTLGLMVGLGKLGLQNSTVRFYAEATSGKSNITEKTFASTALLGMMVTGACATLALLLFTWLAPASFWHDERVRGLMILSSALIFIRVVDSCFINIVRAQQRSGVYGIYSVVRRYIGLGIILLVIFYIVPGLLGYYIGTVVSEALAVLSLAWFVLRRHPISPAAFSWPLMRSMLIFGLPMVAFEMSSLLLAQGDRYVIQGLLGGEALGIYSAAYNFSEYVQAALLSSFGTAVTPMFTRLWEKEGQAATQQFIEVALHFYILAGIAVGFGMAAMGGDALAILASKTYLPGAAIIPWVIAGMVLDGANSMLGAGLYLRKRSTTVMALVVCTASLNIGLNFLLVPHQGIMGSAIATLASYCVMTTGIGLCARPYLRIRMPWVIALKASACGMATYLLVVRIGLANPIASLALKLVVAALMYSLLVFACDSRARQALVAICRRMAARARADGAIKPTTDPRLP